MRSDSSDIMHQITVLSHFELAAVRIWILYDGFAVMRQDKVIGLGLNVSVVGENEDHDIALRKLPPSGCHNTRMVTMRPVLVRSRFRPLGNEHIPRPDETVCPLRYPRPGSRVSGKRVQECMRDIDGSQLREASFGSPT